MKGIRLFNGIFISIVCLFSGILVYVRLEHANFIKELEILCLTNVALFLVFNVFKYLMMNPKVEIVETKKEMLKEIKKNIESYSEGVTDKESVTNTYETKVNVTKINNSMVVKSKNVKAALYKKLIDAITEI